MRSASLLRFSDNKEMKQNVRKGQQHQIYMVRKAEVKVTPEEYNNNNNNGFTTPSPWNNPSISRDNTRNDAQ
jgi:hypothetical protein